MSTTDMSAVAAPAPLDPSCALMLLQNHVTGDLLDIVVDLTASRGCRLVDCRRGGDYLDMTMFYSSAPLGYGHPGLCEPEFEAELLAAARVKPANPDFATIAQARFVQRFSEVLGDEELPYLFFIDGGALAVENALKVAFDWKTKRNASRGVPVQGWRALHLTHAFHGRSGYTLSLTNTSPGKTANFPLFDWPRIPSPAVFEPEEWANPELLPAEHAALLAADAALGRYPNEVACFIYEPIQGEGGDRHLRPVFLRAMEELCRANDVLTAADEVQTGCGTVGRAWAYQELGLRPDLVAFGKKTQVCGVMGGRRVLEVRENAFRERSRISSTWGGSLVDMVRCTRVLDLIQCHDLFANARAQGEYLVGELRRLAAEFPDLVSRARGRGLFCALSVVDPYRRDLLLTLARERYRTLLLPGGERELRWRPPLTVTRRDLADAIDSLRCAARDVRGMRSP